MTTSSVSVGSVFRVYSDHDQRMTNMFITITQVYERDGKTLVDAEAYQNGSLTAILENGVVCSNWIPQ